MQKKPVATKTNGEKRIFIVYANHDVELAETLKQLFRHWGFHAFYCRQEHREQATSEPYRDDLREELQRADLGVLLLSRDSSFRRIARLRLGQPPPLGNIIFWS